jgi:tetratricopeptide (TPR) repeat protein
MSMVHLLNRRTAAGLAFAVLLILELTGCGSPEDQAKSYYDHGMQLMAEHDNARAAVEFKNAVKVKKDYIPAWRALAKIAELDRNWAGVVPPLRTVIELDPKDVDDRLKLARLLVLGGASDEALKVANEANEIDNRNANALATKAAVLFRLSDANGAVQAAQAALDLDPKNVGAMSVIAADKLARGDSKGALETLNEATTNKDDLGTDLFKLKILENSQDLPRAEALLRKLINLYPTEPAFRKELVRLYVFQHRPDDAVKEQRAVVAALPNDSGAELDLVRLLNTFSGPLAARQELVTRIAAGGDVFPYQIALAEFDFAQGNVDAAVDLLKSLISANSSPENVQTAQVKLAEFYLSKKQIQSAEALVSDILRKDNRNIGGLRLRAAIRMGRGELEPAINDLRQALNDQPRSPELMLMLATAYEQSGSIELAEKQFADAMRATNFNPTISLNYVAFLQRRGSITRAEDVLTDLANRWSQNLQVLSSLAQVKLLRQDWAGAQAIADNIRRLGNANDSGIADEISGAALAGQHKLDESITALQSAYSASPSATQPMAALVNAYLRAKQTDKAVNFLQNVLKANPANADAYIFLGQIEQATNRPDQAAKSFNAAIAASPKDVNGYWALAKFYLSQNKTEAAQNAIHAGLKEQPDSAVLHLTLASILEAKGDFDGEITEYESILTKDPNSLIAANNLASLLADHRTDQASLERAQSLTAILQKSPVAPFKDTLGWVNYRKGDYSGALPLLEQAAAALPNRAIVHYHLGMAYIATNQRDKAAEQLNAALNQAPDPELKVKIQTALKEMGS